MVTRDCSATGVDATLVGTRRGEAVDKGVAVVIPCHDEAATIATVITDFRRALPGARIVVVDNASSDDTAMQARSAGALVVTESRKGKGYALLRGFRCVQDAEYIVMVDGDDTYPAEDVGKLLAALDGGADMAIGTRLVTFDEGAFRPHHGAGNRIFILLIRLLFGVRTRDLFSGYRVLTQRFVETSPLIAQGFEVETELSIQALAHGFNVVEVPVHYRARHEGSNSKLHTYRDGYRILLALLAFFRDYRPLTFFGALGLVFFAASVASGSVVVAQYLHTGAILRVPLAILSVGLALLGAVSVIGGLILSSISRRTSQLAALISRR